MNSLWTKRSRKLGFTFFVVIGTVCSLANGTGIHSVPSLFQMLKGCLVTFGAIPTRRPSDVLPPSPPSPIDQNNRRQELALFLRQAQISESLARNGGKKRRLAARIRELKQEIADLGPPAPIPLSSGTPRLDPEAKNAAFRQSQSADHHLTQRSEQEWMPPQAGLSGAVSDPVILQSQTAGRRTQLIFPNGRRYAIYRDGAEDFIMVRYGDIRKTESYQAFAEEVSGQYIETNRRGSSPDKAEYQLVADGTVVLQGNGHHRALAEALENRPREVFDEGVRLWRQGRITEDERQYYGIDDSFVRVPIKKDRGRWLAAVKAKYSFDTATYLGLTLTHADRTRIDKVKEAGARDNGWQDRPDPH